MLKALQGIGIFAFSFYHLTQIDNRIHLIDDLYVYGGWSLKGRVGKWNPSEESWACWVYRLNRKLCDKWQEWWIEKLTSLIDSIVPF